MITPEQARAARAMLNWKQAELAQAAGVSVTAINYLENEMGAARSDTLNKIQAAYEEAGIEFLAPGGVMKKENAFQLLNHQGDDFIAKFNADLYRSLRLGGSEILTCSSDEEAWNRYAPRQNKDYAQFARKHKIRERILVTAKPEFLNNDARYRVLQPSYMGGVTYSLYADRVAYILWPQKRLVILRNGDLHASLAAQFEILWANAKGL